MVEKLNDLLPVILIGFFLWLIGLSIVFYRLLSHYQRLFRGSKRESIREILESVIKEEQTNKRTLLSLKEEIEVINTELLKHIQRVGLVRFNAFGGVGDGQSFSLALMDKHDNGLILTCLHARDRTRMYAKPIKTGKSTVELSTDEEKALKIAQKS